MALLESRQGLSGQYGYQNNAPILNASVAQSLLGDEFYKPIDLDQNQLGWGTNSKYQGAITTGAGLYGVKGTQKEIRDLLATGDRYTSKISESGVVRSTDPETGQVTFAEPVQGEDGFYYRPIGAQMFNTATGEDSNAEENFNKWKNITSRLQTAANNLRIDYTNLTGGQLLDAINATDKRIAVTGRTQFWDPSQTGIGGQEGPQHATVIYTQQDGKLVPVAPPQTFEFQDYKTSGVFRRPFEGMVDLLQNPAIAMALGAYVFGPGGLLSDQSIPFGAGAFEGYAPGTGPLAAESIPGITSLVSEGIPIDTGAVNATPAQTSFPSVEVAPKFTPVPGSLQAALPEFGVETQATRAPFTAVAGTFPAAVAGGLLSKAATPSISATDVLRAGNLATQLTERPQQQDVTQQMPVAAPTGVDYSGLLNLLGSQARTSGLLGTQFQPQPINLASLLG
jgi:hypothetical protein